MALGELHERIAHYALTADCDGPKPTPHRTYVKSPFSLDRRLRSGTTGHMIDFMGLVKI